MNLQSIAFAGGGISASVIALSSTRVKKLFSKRDECNFAFVWQRRLHKVGLAPRVFQTGRGTAINGDKHWYYVSARAKMDTGGASTVARYELGCEILAKTGMILTDPHEGNVGWLYGRWVLIDCCTSSLRRAKRNETYLDYWKAYQKDCVGS